MYFFLTQCRFLGLLIHAASGTNGGTGILYYQNGSFDSPVCFDLFSYHYVFSSPPSTLIYHREGVSNILTQRGGFERHDIYFGSDKYRAKRGPINEEDKFISIYDQTYGSLRLSGCILEEQILTQVLERLKKNYGIASTR